MCLYCTYLWLTSPYAKAKAIADFLLRIDLELQTGQNDLLCKLAFPEETIDRFRKAHALGCKLIIDSEDCLQRVYRMHFREWQSYFHGRFLYWTEWAICNSPIEFPISDSALVQRYRQDHSAVYYVLPVGPKLLLKAKIHVYPEQISSSFRRISGGDLMDDEAQYWFDAICSSAASELAASRLIPGIALSRSRAKANGITFPSIVDPELMLSAGLTDSNSEFGLRVISEAEYVKFIDAFIQPPVVSARPARSPSYEAVG